MRYFFLKLAIFIIVFVATCAIVTVDYSCAKAACRDSYIGLSASRDDEVLVISGFGGRAEINLDDVKNRALQVKDRVEALEVWDYIGIQ